MTRENYYRMIIILLVILLGLTIISSVLLSVNLHEVLNIFNQ